MASSHHILDFFLEENAQQRQHELATAAKTFWAGVGEENGTMICSVLGEGSALKP